jgi:hypothetical protein
VSSLQALLGGPAASFVGMTVVLFGAAAAMTGQALARNWRAAWQLLPYALLLAAGDRFLLYALFAAQLLSITGYLLAAAILLAIAGLAFRVTQAGRMCVQYPWLYQRAGLFSWRERA